MAPVLRGTVGLTPRDDASGPVWACQRPVPRHPWRWHVRC